MSAKLSKKVLLSYFEVGLQTTERAKEMFEQDEADSGFEAIACAIKDLKKRIDKDELMVLIAGEVKAGKSTFINALVGRKVCSTAQIVCTNVCTVIRYGEEFKVFVNLYDAEGKLFSKEISENEIPEYSTENLNPKNEKGVAYLVVQTPSKILSEGVVLIDSPGLGAIDPKHAQETLMMAQNADVLFFLGNTDHEITSFEIASLKSLIEVSKTESVAHILTCCDRGDKDAIAHENEKKLKEFIPSINIPVIEVSSLMYQRYVKTQNEAFLDHSGFKTAMAFIYSVGISKDAILAHMGGVQLRGLLDIIKAKIESYKGIAIDPTKYDTKLEELNAAEKKLQQLIKNQNNWKFDIRTNVRTVKSNVAGYREKKKTKSLMNVKHLLEYEMYRDNKQSLTTAIQANLSSSLDDIQNNLYDEINEAFVKAKRNSKLESIEQTIYCASIENPGMEDIVYTNESRATVAMRYGRRISLGSMLGGTVGGLVASGLSYLGTTAVGAKVGAIIGSVFPGLGNLIGATSGALLGVLVGILYAIFETKEHKKSRLYSACEEKIKQFYLEAGIKINAAIDDTVAPLERQFLDVCQGLVAAVRKEISELRNRQNTAQTHMNEINKLIENLSSLVNNLPKK